MGFFTVRRAGGADVPSMYGIYTENLDDYVSADAIEFFMAGATAIEIGTANFLDPEVTIKVRDGINQWLDDHGCKSVNEIIGAVI